MNEFNVKKLILLIAITSLSERSMWKNKSLKVKSIGRWWWSSGQHTRLWLWRSKFESNCLLNFCKKTNIKEKEAGVGPSLKKVTSIQMNLRREDKKVSTPLNLNHKISQFKGLPGFPVVRGWKTRSDFEHLWLFRFEASCEIQRQRKKIRKPFLWNFVHEWKKIENFPENKNFKQRQKFSATW